MDFDKGMPIEVDSLNGYICIRASEQGIQAPENAKLVQEVSYRPYLSTDVREPLAF